MGLIYTSEVSNSLQGGMVRESSILGVPISCQALENDIITSSALLSCKVARLSREIHGKKSSRQTVLKTSAIP